MTVPLTVSGFNAGVPMADIDAGLPMVGLFHAAAVVFPILGPVEPIDILPDTPPGSWGLAWYMGLDAGGHPRFSVRDDVMLNTKIGFHESGHAFEEVLERAYVAAGIGAQETCRTAYWAFRGFPGTWQEAVAYASSMPGASSAWQFLPGESWAEAFSAAVSGTVQSEWTMTYGKDLALAPGNLYDPTGGALRARVFFQGLVQRLPTFEEDDMFSDADRALLQRVKDLMEAEGPKVWAARVQRSRDVETGRPYDPNKPPVDPRISQP